MKNAPSLLLWLLAGAAGLILLAWAYPRAFPFLPRSWSVSRAQAVDIALERLRDLDEPVKDPYVVARLRREVMLERRLQVALDHGRAGSVRESQLAARLNHWEVHV